MSDAHCNNLTQRKALGLVTHDNTGGPFVVECHGCGVVYPSFQCNGGGQIADTGDYEDARCPHCGHVDPEECENPGLAWNTQQLKINELQQRLNATDVQIDLLTPRHTEQPEGKREPFQKWVMATKHPVYGFLDGRSLARGDDRTGYADEYVQGLWVAYLAFGVEQPAPVAVALPQRSPEDYAVEHAEYMAKSADDVLAKFQAYGLALLAVDESDDDGEGELFENIDSARGDLQEALVDLRAMVYEFRKRAAKSR
ncbi:hypothetical protein HX810_09870 [Pseudomonas salomonii]|uniref:Uncharacterized protein n=1 Tax=Pseudomonas salomonii TaxID=191391 RepID=A0A7Y8GCX5_9PSED|nr:hypothetical protein [Pseudomonas salomonii]NWF07970.1 hypothetical protein [Pseudomonas salomonii]